MKRVVYTGKWMTSEGRPTWHQMKAGHAFASSGKYDTEAQAREYQKNFKKHHPDEPCVVYREFYLEPFTYADGTR
jgi:hypothetical protein